MPVHDFLNQRAVNIVVSGNYTLPNWYEFARQAPHLRLPHRARIAIPDDR